MTEPTEGRVAVYIDFDNIVISRYEQKHRRGRGHMVNLRDLSADSLRADPELAARLTEARVDLGAVLDFASSFGSITVSRAYADWSIEVNSAYKDQLMERAVELVQLFPAVKPAKNGADIRLAVDVVEDLFRLPDLTHVVIVAGDSDYIALAQRCKRLGRYVVGIGVAGATSKFLASACDEFADYDSLPGISDADLTVGSVGETEAPKVSEPQQDTEPVAGAKKTKGFTPTSGKERSSKPETSEDTQEVATRLLIRAMQLGQVKMDEEWVNSSWVKNQMLRMDPSFSERALGFSKFNDFVASRSKAVELKKEGLARLIRLRPIGAAKK